MSESDQGVEVRPARAEVQGRYLLRRAAGDGAAPILVCLHGYGENAERLLEAVVEVPVASAWHLVAIQALHPFYNPRTGEVLASWMTKLDREEAIRDNITYVGRVVGEVKNELAPGDADRPLVFLGFSQGTAMAYRAAFGGGHDCAGVVALAGDFPHEIMPREGGAHPRVLIGRGTEDEWYDEAKMENDLARLSAFDVEVETCVFDAGHEWTPEFRSCCADFLRRCAG